MHEAYHIEGKTDLAVIRSQALERTKPNNRYGRRAEQCVVHHHAYDVPCSPAMEHDFFAIHGGDNKSLAALYWEGRGYTIRDLHNIKEASESA